MQFVFTHNGRSVEPDTTPEDEGMEDGDEIVAVELMDLTDIADDLAVRTLTAFPFISTSHILL